MRVERATRPPLHLCADPMDLYSLDNRHWGSSLGMRPLQRSHPATGERHSTLQVGCECRANVMRVLGLNDTGWRVHCGNALLVCLFAELSARASKEQQQELQGVQRDPDACIHLGHGKLPY